MPIHVCQLIPIQNNNPINIPANHWHDISQPLTVTATQRYFSAIAIDITHPQLYNNFKVEVTINGTIYSYDISHILFLYLGANYFTLIGVAQPIQVTIGTNITVVLKSQVAGLPGGTWNILLDF